jgi:acetyltransferase-like isoleucine patch superfamily enzyme
MLHSSMPRSSPGPVSNLRRVIKVAIFAFSLLIVTPLLLVVWLEKRLSRSEMLFSFCNQLLAPLPGMLGWWLRGAYYYGTLERCSWEVHIGFGSVFTHRRAVVGSRVSLGAYCILGHVQIGDHVRMGSRVSVPSGKHQHFDEDGRLADVNRFERVLIGARSWIGEGAILLANVGERSVVAAGAVVVKEMPGASLIVGNPAQVLRALHDDALLEVAD